MESSESPHATSPTPPPTERRSWLLCLLGIRRRPGHRLAFVPSRWGWVMIAMIVLLGGMIGFAEYSMQPEFCRSCHIMEPYFQAWHQSSHRNVPCGDCHFEPGWQNTLKGKWQASSQAVKYITNTYGSKPHAEVRDVSCLRVGCHEKRLLQGKVQWTVKTQRGDDITIRFDHTPHLEKLRRGKKLRCVSCHSQIVQGKHIVVTLDTCFLCHFKGLKHGRDDETLGGCRACHDAPKQTIRLATGEFNHADYIDRGVECYNCHADAISGDGAVPRQQCWSCHNQPQDLARYGDTGFIHKTHVTDHKVECSSCHIQIIHHLSANPSQDLASDQALSPNEPDSGACGQCHLASHTGPQQLYSGRGGRGVPDMPSPMFRTQVDCIACHRTTLRSGEQADENGQVYAASQASCDHCHGNKYADVLAIWKSTLDEMLAQAHDAEDKAVGLMKTIDLPPTRRLELQRLLDDAHHNIQLVELGHGVHNITYATALLNVAREDCRQVAQAVRKQPWLQQPAPEQPQPQPSQGHSG